MKINSQSVVLTPPFHCIKRGKRAGFRLWEPAFLDDRTTSLQNEKISKDFI